MAKGKNSGNKQQSQPKTRAEEVGSPDASTNEKQVLNSTNATADEAAAVAPGNERGGEGNFNVSDEKALEERKQAEDEAKDAGEQDNYPTNWQAKVGADEPQNADIIGQNDEVKFDGEQDGDFVVVQRDVWRKVYPHNSKRATYLLVYAAGTRIPARALKGNQQEQKSDEKSDDGDNE